MARQRLTPLLESAQEFLIQSIRDFDQNRLNFAIVHAVTATELMLKERLAKVSPALVYKNIDSKTLLKDNTVALGAIPQRLANLGIPLIPQHAHLVLSIAGWRHQIVHHMPAFDADLARQQLPQLLDFLASYLRSEFDTPLETFLPTDLYKSARRLLTDWENAVTAAQASARLEGNVITDACPRCGSAGVMCLRDDTEVHCHLCGAKLYDCGECYACGGPTYLDYPAESGWNYCDECGMAMAEDYYVQMEIDRRLGK